MKCVQVRWGRPANECGLLVYRSKCGRFMVIKKQSPLLWYYFLEGAGIKGTGHDTLAIAKAKAQLIADDEDGLL